MSDKLINIRHLWPSIARDFVQTNLDGGESSDDMAITLGDVLKYYEL